MKTASAEVERGSSGHLLTRRQTDTVADEQIGVLETATKPAWELQRADARMSVRWMHCQQYKEA